MATKFGVRNYIRTGNNVSFQVVALNANGSVDTAYTGALSVSYFNSTGTNSYTYTAGDQGAHTFTLAITNAAARASIVANFAPGGSFTSAAALVVSGAGNDTFNTAAGGENLFVSGPGADTYGSNASNDLFRLEGGGNDTASGGAGDDGFYLGGALSAADRIDGGAGALDQLGLQGNYAGLTLGATTLPNVENLVLLSGTDTRFGDTANNRYSYVITTNDANIAAGQVLAVTANTLVAGESSTFDARAELDGSIVYYGGFGTDIVTGSQNNDSFFFGAERWGSSDSVNGGGGSLDQVAIQGNYTGGNAIFLGLGQLVLVENLVLLSGTTLGQAYSYSITFRDANTTAGTPFYVSANQLGAGETLFLNAGLEQDAPFTVYSGAGADTIIGGALGDTIYGGAGNDRISGQGEADTLYGGAGDDTFVYDSRMYSLPTAADRILDFSTGDLIDLTAVGNFTFVGGGFTAANQIRATSQGGGVYLVEAETTGDGQADLAILVTSDHAITGADFAANPGTAVLAFGDDALVVAGIAPLTGIEILQFDVPLGGNALV